MVASEDEEEWWCVLREKGEDDRKVRVRRLMKKILIEKKIMVV